jgi:serine/threonine protein kinase
MSPHFHEPEMGSLLGRWRLLHRVGSGGNGIVYRVCLAERPGDGSFALKLAGAPGDPRFEREAELLSRLEHPHIPGLRATGTWTDEWGREYPYLVMQWVEGRPLYDWALQRRLSAFQVFRLLGQVARALEATHRHGMHRDVKGDNILVNSEGNAVLVDYGCCWYPGARPLTDSAVPPGTPPYRSPKCLRFQYRHRRDREAHYSYPAADDLYALGVTAYHLLTGTYPSRGTDPECADDPRRPRPPKRLAISTLVPVHPELEALIERMLQEEPEARGSVSELAEACEKAAESTRPTVDLPEKPSHSMPQPHTSTRLGPPRESWLRKQAPWLAAGAVTLTSTVLLLGLPSNRHEFEEFEDETPPRAESRESQDAGVASEEAVGLADAGVEESLASVAARQSAGTEPAWIGREIPKDPQPGQRKPPCTLPRETTIRGTCWILVPPPCLKSDFEWENRCYMPSYNAPRQPTSDGEK